MSEHVRHQVSRSEPRRVEHLPQRQSERGAHPPQRSAGQRDSDRLGRPPTTRERLIAAARAERRASARPRLVLHHAVHPHERSSRAVDRDAPPPGIAYRLHRGKEHASRAARLAHQRPPARGPPHHHGGDDAHAHSSRVPIVQAMLTVSCPDDPLEREAEAVAARVLRGDPPSATLNLGTAGAQADSTAHVPDSVLDAVRTTSGGSAVPAAVRERLEPHLGASLSRIRVRQDDSAAQAAKALGARAFTSGSTIYLAAGSSPSDVQLMAHEATHVVQQRAVPRARAALHRSVSDYLPDISVSDLIPAWVMNGIRSAIRAVPGYTLLSYLTGQDVLTGAPVQVSRAQLVESFLTFGPFAIGAGPVLSTLDVLDQVFDIVSGDLAAHNLTLARVSRDIQSAFTEFSADKLIDGNVAVVRRYLDAIIDDIKGFVASIADRVITLIRSVVAKLAEPLLQTPQIAPIWNLARKVLRYDPLRGEPVEAPTVEILADFLKLIGQEQRLAQMQERGTLQETADWIDTQLGTFAGLVGELGGLFTQAWDAIQPQNLASLPSRLPALADEAFGLMRRVGTFATTLIIKVLELVKHALLEWLAENGRKISGYTLMTVILGSDPVTGAVVERTPENLIKGFITLLPDGEATYEQLAKAGVIADAAGQINDGIARLGISVEMVSKLFHGIWDSLTLDDLLKPIAAFQRVLAQFGEPLRRLIEFVGIVLQVVVTLILKLMNFPSDLLAHIVTTAMQAIEDIKRDPVAFLKNVLSAMKLGFTMFFDHIGTHLLTGLKDWLFRGLKGLGIVIPADLTLKSILTLVLQVLDITAEKLWTKLGEQIGPENVLLIRKALDTLSGVWEFIKDVQENGISAVWKFLTDQLANLWDTLLGMAIDWIIKTVIGKAVTKLLTFLDPTGIMAVINSCVAFFNAVQSAIEYLRDMLEIVDKYVSTIGAVAAGNILPGAQMLEGALAAAVPVAIGFLANQVGLGNIPEMVVEVIGKLRALVDKAITWLIKKAIDLGKAALKAITGGGKKDKDAAEKGPLNQAQAAIKGKLTGHEHPDQMKAVVSGVLSDFKPVGLAGLELRGPDDKGEYDLYGAASPWRLFTHFASSNYLDKGTVMRVTLHVNDAAAEYPFQRGVRPVQYQDRTGSTGAMSKLAAQGKEIGPLLPRPGKQPAAVGVVERPPAGSTKLELLTFNAKQAGDTSNASHAETKLRNYFNANRPLAGRVQQIDATLNYSPCSRCPNSLNGIVALTPAADGRRYLNWVIPWRGSRFPTTDDSLARIQNWTVNPTTVPATSPQEEALAELRGVEWETIIEPLHTTHPAPALAGSGMK